MNEQELNQKIEQCKKDIETLQKNLDNLKQQKEEITKPKWVAAISGSKLRLILNLAGLPDFTKELLIDSLNNNDSWFSFETTGHWGFNQKTKDGLTFYDNTKIIFGGQ